MPPTIVIAVCSDVANGPEVEVLVAPGTSVVVGRDVGADLVLEDERVSRRHLAVRARRGGVILEDLGSTNGSFLNGRPLTRELGRVGDRVVVGTTVLELRAHAPAPPPPPPVEHDDARSTMHDETPWLAGQLGEIPIFVIIQILSSMRKSGRLVVLGPRTGHVYFGEGDLTDAAVEGLRAGAARKALFRVLSWKGGSFELHPEDQSPPVRTLDAHTQELLLEGHRQLDEWERLAARLPRADARVVCHVDDPASLDAAPLHAELARLARTAPTWGALLDASPATDLDTAVALLHLLGTGALGLRSTE